MIAFFKKKQYLKKAWGQAGKPGFHVQKPQHHNREVTVFMAAFILFALFSANKTFETAMAAPGLGMNSDGVHYTEAERKNLRHFVRSNPDNLLKMSGGDIAVALREPELVRQDFPTVVWQYRTESCVLDTYFASMDDDVSEAPVVHYEIRSREKGVSDSAVFKNCIRSLMLDNNALVMAKASAFYKKKTSYNR